MSNTVKYLCDGSWKLCFGGCYLFTIQSATMEKSDKERIEKDAHRYRNKDITRSHDLKYAETDYIAGATAEHERAQQELQAYRDIIKELLPVAESHLCSAEYGYNSEEYCAKLRDIIKRSNKLIDTVTPTP